MRPCPRWFRPLLVVCLLVPLGLILWSPAHGQFPPNRPNFPQPNIPNIPRPNFPNIPQPNIPRPNFPNIPQPNIPQMQMPQFERIWKCSKCLAEVGRGDIPPSINRCPHCGITLRGGSSPAPFDLGNQNFGPGQGVAPPLPVAEASSGGSSAVLWIVLSVIGVLVMGGFVVTMLLLTKTSKKTKRKPRNVPVVDVIEEEEEILEFDPEPAFEIVSDAAPRNSAAITAQKSPPAAKRDAIPKLAPRPAVELPSAPPKGVRPSPIKVQAPPLIAKSALPPAKSAPPRPAAAATKPAAKPTPPAVKAAGTPNAPTKSAAIPAKPRPPVPVKRPPSAKP